MTDFTENHPKLALVFTTLDQQHIDTYWLYSQICLYIGTKLGIEDKEMIEKIVKKMKKSGFEYHAVACADKNQILESSIDKLIPKMFSKVFGNVDIESLRKDEASMPDMFKKTDYVRICFFFDDNDNRTKLKNKKPWWKFW